MGPVDYDDLGGLNELHRLFVASHRWALDTATELTVAPTADPTRKVRAPFATPAALVAMKLHAIQDRRVGGGQEKRSSDADDLYRLLLQFDAEGALRSDLAGAPEALRRAVRGALQHVFVDQAARTARWLASSAPTPTSGELLAALASPVVDELDRAVSDG